MSAPQHTLVVQAQAAANGSADGSLGSVVHCLSVRLDRPVEGCLLKPRAYVYSKQKTSTGPVNKAYNQSDHTYEFRWLRGPERQACANPACPRADSFSPLEWSTWALQGTRIQCFVCSKLKVPRHKTIYCNAKCFAEAWKEHQKEHAAMKQQERVANGDHPQAGGNVASTTDVAESFHLDVPGSADNELNLLMRDVGEGGQDEESWDFISSEGEHMPGEDDVGHCLRLECQAVKSDGTLVCTPKSLTTEPVLCQPPPPVKRSIQAIKGAGASAGGVRFRVVSYNLLAELYATQQAYPYCDFWALSWNYRKENLIKEILEASGDILCLQEVQADAYQQHFLPVLTEKGYDGLYKSKTREFMGMAGRVDGCAIFWRRSKFRLCEHYSIEFNDCARQAASGLQCHPDESSQFIYRLSKDNIAQVAVLESLQRPRSSRGSTPYQICVSNTHLYSNPEFPDVKLWQCHTLLQELEHYVTPRNLPLMACGDYNSEPGSAVYELLSTQVMSIAFDHCLCLPQAQALAQALLHCLLLFPSALCSSQHVSRGHVDLGKDPAHVLPDVSELAHSLHLTSAYAAVLGQEPPYTNYTDTFKGVLDYIWCSGKVTPLAVARIPTAKEIERSGKWMPNVGAGSDHMLLSADVVLGSNSY
ncbi:unnamed protein product [Chrysoparadoxa australica]